MKSQFTNYPEFLSNLKTRTEANFLEVRKFSMLPPSSASTLMEMESPGFHSQKTLKYILCSRRIDNRAFIFRIRSFHYDSYICTHLKWLSGCPQIAPWLSWLSLELTFLWLTQGVVSLSHFFLLKIYVYDVTRLPKALRSCLSIQFVINANIVFLLFEDQKLESFLSTEATKFIQKE